MRGCDAIGAPVPAWMTDWTRWFAMKHNSALLSVGVLVMSVVAGCAGGPEQPVATDAPAEQAEVSYWLDQGATAQVTHESFDALFAAADRAARDRFFEISHRDFRRGRLITKPLLSKQAGEFWREDVVDGGGLIESSLSTVRRTVWFEIDEEPSGRFVLTPRVVVERRSVPERRVTDAAQFRAAVAGVSFGAVTDDTGSRLPTQYWYAIGRDHPLERALAADVRRLTKNAMNNE